MVSVESPGSDVRRSASAGWIVRATDAGSWRTALRALLPLAFALALAAPSPAHAQASANVTPPESLWTRDTLGGDWGGFRDALGQYGIRFDLWATGYYQGMFEGTGNDDWDFGGRADLMVSGDTGKLGLWNGGGLHAHVTYRGGDLPGFRGGALWPVHTSGSIPLGSKGEVVATSLYASQRFGDSTRLMLGKINAIDLLASHPFFGGWGTDRFWNVAFVAPPSGVLPPVIMGGVLTHSFAPYALTVMVFDPNDQTTNYSLNRLFEDGVNVSMGLSWSGELAGRKSGLGVTATYSTAEGTDYEQIGLPPGTATSTKKGSYNVAVEASHCWSRVRTRKARASACTPRRRSPTATRTPSGPHSLAASPGTPLSRGGRSTTSASAITSTTSATSCRTRLLRSAVSTTSRASSPTTSFRSPRGCASRPTCNG